MFKREVTNLYPDRRQRAGKVAAPRKLGSPNMSSSYTQNL